jgi:hypothetical protein
MTDGRDERGKAAPRLGADGDFPKRARAESRMKSRPSLMAYAPGVAARPGAGGQSMFRQWPVYYSKIYAGGFCRLSIYSPAGRATGRGDCLR